MKILIQYPFLDGIGGIARYLRSFIESIPRSAAKQVAMLTKEFEKEELFESKIETIKIPTGNTRLSLMLWALKCQKTISNLYRNKRIDAVNLHIPPLIPGLFMADMPYIVTAHTTYLGMSGEYYNEKLYNSGYSFAEIYVKRNIEKRIFQRANRIITLTPQGKHELQRYGIDQARVQICPNGVDTTLYKSQAIPKDIDIIFIGRLEPRKGSVALIKLCNKLIRLESAPKLFIIGHGDDMKMVKKELKTGIITGKITLTGKVGFDETVTYYDRSKIYVSTSYYEGLPGTCLEAMSMGLPSVVWDIPFYTDLVEDSETGFIIPVNNYSMMIDRILYLLKNNHVRCEMGRKARRKVEKDFSWKKLGHRLLGLIDLISK